jgi:hypothetical protein
VGTAHKVGEAGKSSQQVVFESKQDKRRIIIFYKGKFVFLLLHFFLINRLFYVGWWASKKI